MTLAEFRMELLTKPYEAHMIDFLADAEHYFGMTCENFASWEGRALGADGAAGTVRGSGNKIYSSTNNMRRAGWSIPAGSLSLLDFL